MIKIRKKDIENNIGTIIAFSGLAIMFTITTCQEMKDDVRYVVVDKADNKIVFEDLDNVRTRRIIDYDMDSDKKFLDYYEYVNVGDTLVGGEMDADLVMPPYNYTVRPVITVPKIEKINGKYAQSVLHTRQQAARRDSMIVKMNKEKQK